MKFVAYHRTKPSGVEWLGDVPEHWEVKRSDAVVETEKRQVPPENFANEEVFHYSIPAVQELGTGQVENGESIASAKQVVAEPVVLVSRLNPRKATICRAEPQKQRTVASTEFVALKPRKCDLCFLEYLVSTELFRQRLDSWVQSVTRSHQRASPELIYRFWSAWPKPAEQRSIAAFLDRETGRIDKLIAKKRELIEWLKEKRTALISRTVTRGLPPAAAGLPENPPLKPSGHPWLIDVPAHWHVKRVKDIASLVGRIGFRGYSTEDIVDESEGAISMSPSNMVDGSVTLEKCTWLRWEKYHESPEIQLQPDDIVMVKTGSTLGKTAFVDSVPVPMTINPQLMVFKKVKCSKRFLFYFVSSNVIQDVIPLHNSGSTIPTMTQEGISKLPFPYPPLSEQMAIAAYLDEKTAKLDALVAKVETAIERLEEYRTALITAAVTGKIKVAH